jgi:hypothetical protein
MAIAALSYLTLEELASVEMSERLQKRFKELEMNANSKVKVNC